jgi:hypothetical protein
MRKALFGTVFAALFATLAYACAAGNGEPEGAPVAEAGPLPDSGRKDATLLPDAEEEDGATPDPEDAGTDAPTDAKVDAKVDAGPDGAATAYLDDAGTFMVVRVGSAGSGVVLSAAAAAVFIEERRLGSGTVTQTIAMPIAAAAPQAAFTLRGTATTEGALSLSSDGAFVVLGGYSATPGTADVATTTAAAVPRVVARVTKAGITDTSTILDTAFDGKSVRGATSADGTSFWVSGEGGTGMTGGIYYVAQGTTGGTQIFDTPQNLRTVGVFDGQLYASTQSGSGAGAPRLFSVGAGMPTTAGQLGTNLAGITDANTTPHGFVLLDLDPAIAGVDTMYVADTRAVASGGGIQKWKLVAATWTLAATFKAGLSSAPVAVAAKPVGTSVVVLCVTLDNPAKIVRFLDDGVNVNPLGATLGVGTATFAQYRGIALTPP